MRAGPRRLAVVASVVVDLVVIDFVGSGVAPQWVPRLSFLPRPPDDGWLSDGHHYVDYERELFIWQRSTNTLDSTAFAATATSTVPQGPPVTDHDRALPDEPEPGPDCETESFRLGKLRLRRWTERTGNGVARRYQFTVRITTTAGDPWIVDSVSVRFRNQGRVVEAQRSPSRSRSDTLMPGVAMTMASLAGRTDAAGPSEAHLEVRSLSTHPRVGSECVY